MTTCQMKQFCSIFNSKNRCRHINWQSTRYLACHTYTTQSYYGHYTGQPVLADIISEELEDFVGAKFYCPHALADGN